MSKANKYDGCDRHNKFNPSCQDCFAPTEAKPAAHPPGLTARLDKAGFHVVSTNGNGQFELGTKYRYVPESLLQEAQERERLLTEALEEAKVKLELYRAEHSGAYVGGMEYMQLMQKIDDALAKIRGTNG